MMSPALQQVFWFLVTIGVLIPIHEYGHYRVAVACNIKVLRFSVGFGRVLWSRRFGKDGVEFALSMIPLGGYVNMVREPDENLAPGEEDRALNRRPLYQRFAVLAAGPLANLLLAVLLFAFVQWYGVDEPAPVTSTPIAGSLMAEAGLRSGDHVVAVARGATPADEDWRDVRSLGEVYDTLGEALMDRQPLQLRVMHPGETGQRTLKVAIDTLDPDQAGSGAGRRVGLGSPFAQPRIGEVSPGTPAALAGLKAGDLVERVDGTPVADAQALHETILASVRDGKARPMQWEVSRGGSTVALAVTARLEGEGNDRAARVGIAFAPFEHVLVRDDPLTALREGALQTWRTASGSLRMFGRMLVGRASLKNLSGPLTIADVASKSANLGLAAFVSFLAFVSVSLGVLNLLPVPMLDGGTLLYYLIEGATGRRVSDLWQARLQLGGLLAIVLMMSIALSNDVARFLGLQ